MIHNFMDSSAEFSDDKTERFVLTRIWGKELPFAMCVGLNPSTANESKNDNTISLLINVLSALGFGGLRMVNVFSKVTSKPDELKVISYGSAVLNKMWITATAYGCQEIIFCWGNFKEVTQDHILDMIELFPDAKCFGRNKNGSPWHPRKFCYIKGFTPDKAKLIRYVGK